MGDSVAILRAPQEVSDALAPDIGLEEIDNGIWSVYFGPLKLGRLLERYIRIKDACGRLKRQHK